MFGLEYVWGSDWILCPGGEDGQVGVRVPFTEQESSSPDIPNTLELIAKEDIDFLPYMSWEGEQPDASRMQVSVDYKSVDTVVCTNCDYKSTDTIINCVFMLL